MSNLYKTKTPHANWIQVTSKIMFGWCLVGSTSKSEFSWINKSSDNVLNIICTSNLTSIKILTHDLHSKWHITCLILHELWIVIIKKLPLHTKISSAPCSASCVPIPVTCYLFLQSCFYFFLQLQSAKCLFLYAISSKIIL
jgi:hypothetical protein